MSNLRRNIISERKPHWLQIINEWQGSGKNIISFCKEKKIPVSSFYLWRTRLVPDYPLRTKRTKQVPSQQPLFVPVQITQDLSSPLMGKGTDDVILHYPNGCYVKLGKSFDPQILSWINKAMGV